MEDIIKTVLVDDDKTSILMLKALLGGQFPKIDVIGTGDTVEQRVLPDVC